MLDTPIPTPLPSATRLVAELAARGEPRRYERGVRLIHEGDTGDTLFIILQGRLRVFSTGDDGNELRHGLYGPGEYVGEMSLDGGCRSAHVEAAEPTLCALVDRPLLQAFIAERPAFAMELLAKVIRRARAATLSLKQLALNDVYGRLRQALLADAAPDERAGLVIAGPLVAKELAARVGGSPAMVNRLLRDLRHGGYLQADAQGRTLLKSLPAQW